ncbi:MAG: alpha/beta fold hydrolase, partial [Giesbergeria sp.]
MSPKKHIHKCGAWLSAIAMVASLAACGGGSDALDPLLPYRDQTLQWAPCDTTILGWSEEDLWEQLGDKLQCSTMRAPMDWAQPERSDVFVSVMRLAAADPGQRRGAMLFNPGGPGGDGLALALRLFQAFGQSNPESTQGALQLRLLASYDMVGFSPRGTGASTRLACGTNELKRFVDPSPLALTDANLANAAYNDRKTAEACGKNPLTPYVTTDATARDMDLLRGLLGEAKLNYVGYSYGTWLGSWYANLFPEKVGRMVLDSSLDFTHSHEQTFIDMAAARQQLHDGVLLPYAARHS